MLSLAKIAKLIFIFGKPIDSSGNTLLHKLFLTIPDQVPDELQLPNQQQSALSHFHSLLGVLCAFAR